MKRLLASPAVRLLNSRARPYLAAALLVLATALVAIVFRRLPHANLSLLFLLAVLVVAARWGLWPSIVAGIASFLILNFFFTTPYYTLAVEEQGDVATLVFFLAMATLTGNLAARMRTEMANRQAALARVSTLLRFSRHMATAASTDAVLNALVQELADSFSATAVALTPATAGGLIERARKRRGRQADSFDVEAAGAEWRAGRLPRQAGWTCLALETRGVRAGLAALAAAELTHARKELAKSLCDQAAITVERIRLVDDLKAAQVKSETEQLRSALLSSVSHDLRTPLASIIGSASSVLEYGDRLQPESRRDLLQTVLDESERLNRYIQNLLDMTRLGQPGFAPELDWVDLNDLVSAALGRLGTAVSDVNVKVLIDDDAAVVLVQGALIEQALINLLDNASNHAPAGSTITVSARAVRGSVLIEVVDEGPGIPPEDAERVFDMFFRTSRGNNSRDGVGLGLAISRGLVNAHGGSIRALPGELGVGTRMQIRLPAPERPRSVSHG